MINKWIKRNRVAKMELSTFLTRAMMPLIEGFSQTNCWSLFKGMRLRHENEQKHVKVVDEKLTTLFKFAQNEVLYWQTQFQHHNIKAEDITPQNIPSMISSLPITTKKTYTSGFPDQVTALKTKSNWQYLSSSGTSERMTVATDFVKRDYLRAAEYLNLFLATGSPVAQSSMDIPPNACNVVCGLSNSEPEPLFSYIKFKLKTKTLFNADALSDIRGRVERQIIFKRTTKLPIAVASWQEMLPQLDDYLDEIIEHKIKVIRGLPHFLYWLALRANARNLLFPHVTALLPYGGLVCDEMERFISSVFDAHFTDIYGTGEVGSIGCAQHSNEIEIYQDLIFADIVDENGASLPPGQSGRLIVTDLTNFAMPIIKYEIGDYAHVCERNPTDNKLLKFKLMGRCKELLSLASKKKLSPRELSNIVYSFRKVTNFRLEQLSSSRIKIVISIIEPLTEFELDELSTTLMEALELNSLPKIKIVPFILPEPSGKFIAIKIKAGEVYA